MRVHKQCALPSAHLHRHLCDQSHVTTHCTRPSGIHWSVQLSFAPSHLDARQRARPRLAPSRTRPPAASRHVCYATGANPHTTAAPHFYVPTVVDAYMSIGVCTATIASCSRCRYVVVVCIDATCCGIRARESLRYAHSRCDIMASLSHIRDPTQRYVHLEEGRLGSWQVAWRVAKLLRLHPSGAHVWAC